MSWLWGSSKPQATAPAIETASEVRSEPVDVSHKSAPIPKPKLSREEQAQQELDDFLKDFQQQSETDREQRVIARETGVSYAPPLPDDISPESLYPKEMSCRSALDYAMFCQSFGGQFVNVYRHGQFRSCSNHWSDFWLCMRTRNWDEKDKTKAVQDHYKQKAIKWKTGPSSEDVWEVRTQPVKDAFQDNLEELEAKIAEWKKVNPQAADPWAKAPSTNFSNPAPSS